MVRLGHLSDFFLSQRETSILCVLAVGVVLTAVILLFLV